MHARHRSRFRGRNLPSTFAQEMAFYGASDAWDFTTQTYIRGGVLAPSGITFTRASVGSYLNSNNTMTVFSSGQPRIGDKGLLIEGSRQNLFLNSEVGATQSITVTAAAHTLSFYGTGTVTLSGVSTAGPLVGTGAGQRVTLTFTPTAGSLTLTVSGTVEYVQLEVGAFASSWIPTEGASVQRAADVITAVPSAGTDYPLTLFAEIERTADTGGNESYLVIDTGSSAELANLYVDSSDAVRLFVRQNASTQANVPTSATTVGNIYKAAGRVKTNDTNAALGGTAGTPDTAVSEPNTPTRIVMGSAVWFNSAFGYLRRIAVINRALTDAELQGITG